MPAKDLLIFVKVCGDQKIKSIAGDGVGVANILKLELPDRPSLS